MPNPLASIFRACTNSNSHFDPDSALVIEQKGAGFEIVTTPSLCGSALDLNLTASTETAASRMEQMMPTGTNYQQQQQQQQQQQLWMTPSRKPRFDPFTGRPANSPAVG
jgi:hypothetical protein